MRQATDAQLAYHSGYGLRTEGRDFMGASGQVAWLALSIFQALVEFSGKTSIIPHRSCNADCPCYEKKPPKICVGQAQRAEVDLSSIPLPPTATQA